MKAETLYGDRMNQQATEAFNALWDGFSSVEMGRLRRGIRRVTGHHAPPAPQLDADLWEWRRRLVQFCDGLLLSTTLTTPTLPLTTSTTVTS